MDSIKKKYCSEDGCPRAKLYATNWLEDVSDSSDFDLVEVTFKNTRNGYYRNPDGLPLKIGDIVAVEAAPGYDIGRVSMTGKLVRLQMRKNGARGEKESLKKVYRFATAADMEKFEAARSREHATMIRARKIAEELSLDMKIGDVEYQGDGAKAIFYYIADERVDFRKLIRVLADTFKVKIEMKQIGARQEAGRIGGIGPCGRPLCCSSWMTHFVSVGTGAARLQDLSMNPQKLAGQCAKLKCCINFETDIYAEAVKKLPPKDVALETQDATYYYFKPDIIAGKITYSTDKKIPANLVTIDAARANEIIALNKQGVKVESLEADTKKKGKKEEEAYVDLVEQESLTRFDKSKRKNKKNRNGRKAGSGQNQQQNSPQNGNNSQNNSQEKAPNQEKPQNQQNNDRNQRRRRPRPQKPKAE